MSVFPRNTSIIALAAAFASLAMVSSSIGQDGRANEICPPESERIPQVCFYTEENFGGRFFCELGCRTVNEVNAQWRASIKSIETKDGASVQICSDFNRSGECLVVSHDWPDLPAGLRNHVYSYRTEDNVR